MTCPICSKAMPAWTWRNGNRRLTCSRACGMVLASLTARTHNADVDPMAVFRLLEGWAVHSTRGERIAAVRTLTTQGRSAAWIADYLHITSRTVVRYRVINREAAAA